MSQSTLYYVVPNQNYGIGRRFDLKNMGSNDRNRDYTQLKDRNNRDRIVIHRQGPNSYRFQIYRSRHAFWNGARTGTGTTAKQCLQRAYTELLK